MVSGNSCIVLEINFGLLGPAVFVAERNAVSLGELRRRYGGDDDSSASTELGADPLSAAITAPASTAAPPSATIGCTDSPRKMAVSAMPVTASRAITIAVRVAPMRSSTTKNNVN